MKRVFLLSGEELTEAAARERGRGHLLPDGRHWVFEDAQLCANAHSCALLKRNGSVVTYGHAAYGRLPLSAVEEWKVGWPE